MESFNRRGRWVFVFTPEAQRHGGSKYVDSSSGWQGCQAPSTSLGISALGSNAAQTPQLRLAQDDRSEGLVSIVPGKKFLTSEGTESSRRARGKLLTAKDAKDSQSTRRKYPPLRQAQGRLCREERDENGAPQFLSKEKQVLRRCAPQNDKFCCKCATVRARRPVRLLGRCCG